MSTGTFFACRRRQSPFACRREHFFACRRRQSFFACRRRQSFLHVDGNNLFLHVDGDIPFCMSTVVLACRRRIPLCTFRVGNVLRATTACTFSTSQLPKVLRTWCALYIFTWKRASRHNGVQFFISHLARWLRTRHFSEPTFRPSGATNHWRNTVFPTFSRTCIFFLVTLSLDYSLL